MKRLVPMLGLLLLLMAVNAYPAWGGEPTGKIGPRNPTMYRCVDKDDPREIKVDRMAVEPIKEIADNDPSTLDSNCFVTTVSDFGFDTKDAALFSRPGRDVVVEPARAKLIPGFDDVKKAALKSGALGCSISGGGPTVFAALPAGGPVERVAGAMRWEFKGGPY